MKFSPEQAMLLLEREIMFLYKSLADYGYFMGDLSPLVAPWYVLDGDCEASLSEEAEPWVLEGSLLVALTVLWGQRDGAHSIKSEEMTRILDMIERLRPRSARTRKIAHAIDIVRQEEDDDIAARHSQAIYREFVVGYLKKLASLAEGNGSIDAARG